MAVMAITVVLTTDLVNVTVLNTVVVTVDVTYLTSDVVMVTVTGLVSVIVVYLTIVAVAVTVTVLVVYATPGTTTDASYSFQAIAPQPGSVALRATEFTTQRYGIHVKTSHLVW